MKDQIFVLVAIIPVTDRKEDEKIQSRASRKYADNWDDIFGKKSNQPNSVN